MIEDEPLDIDTDWPRAMPREQARLLLENWVERGLVSQANAQSLWDDVLGPLYDSRAAAGRFSRGRCTCGAVHPAWRLPNYTGKSTPHRMNCRHYVGPLEHRRVTAVNESYSFSGSAMSTCSCGKRYPYWADEEAREAAVCPDILFVWRGPRPEPQEDAMSEQDEAPRSNAEVQEEYGVASDSQVAVEAERERLEKLAEKDQVGPDTSESEEGEQPDTEDEDHEPSDEPTADNEDADDEQGKEGETFHK